MTNYYVRTAANGGSDAAAGTSPATAWATIGKALGAAGIASGDTVYVGSGTHIEGTSALINVQMTSAVAETKIIGDVTGQYTGDTPGPVIFSAFISGDDSAPSATNSLLRLQGRDYLTFENIWFYGASVANGIIDGSTNTSTNITFTDCYFTTPGVRGRHITYAGAADINASWLFDRCIFLAFSTTFASITLNTSAAADYDANITFRNCEVFHFGGNGTITFQITTSGAGAFKGGTVNIDNCTIIAGNGSGSVVATSTANVSTGKPVNVRNCFINGGGGVALNANTSGQIVEDYNYLVAATPRTNVSVGAASFSETKQTDIEVGQSRILGRAPRLTGTPTSGSKLISRGSHGSVSQTVDFQNRPRPGVASLQGWGALERHDVAAKETSVTDAGGVGIKITGPYTQDLQIPVSAAATTITVRCRYDTNHAATNKPQAILQTNGEIGVTTSTATGAAAIDTWETLSIGPFTPTAAGVVTVRLVSRSAAASGIAYFDSVTVA